MLEIPVIPVVIPFVQIAHVADGVGVQLGQCLLHLLVLFTKDLSCGDGVDKQFTDDSQIGSTAITGGAVIALIRLIFVLWRGAGCCDQLAWLLGIVDEPAQTELGSTLHQWVGCGLQVVLVLCELIALPKGVHQPGTTQIPVRPLRTLVLLTHGVGHRPDVAVVARAPAFTYIIIVLGSILTVGSQTLDESIQRLSHLSHIGNESRPVVLFQIDVHGIVSTPGRPQLWCPEAL